MPLSVNITPRFVAASRSSGTSTILNFPAYTPTSTNIQYFYIISAQYFSGSTVILATVTEGNLVTIGQQYLTPLHNDFYYIVSPVVINSTNIFNLNYGNIPDNVYNIEILLYTLPAIATVKLNSRNESDDAYLSTNHMTHHSDDQLANYFYFVSGAIASENQVGTGTINATNTQDTNPIMYNSFSSNPISLLGNFSSIYLYGTLAGNFPSITYTINDIINDQFTVLLSSIISFTITAIIPTPTNDDDDILEFILSGCQPCCKGNRHK